MSRSTAGLLLSFAIAWATTGQAAAEDQPSIKAFSAWQGRGQIFETGPNRLTFVGAFTGMIFIDAGEGPIDAGFMTCPTIVDVNANDGKESAKGRCTITAKDGARVYADLACEGVRLVGCSGEFRITGGTDRFIGITGGGPVKIRSTVSEIAAGGGNIVEGAAAGVIVWQNLAYKIPSQ
jgi:hypothetical protein